MTASAARSGNHERFEFDGSEREYIGLCRTHTRHIMLISIDDERIDSLLPEGNVPIKCEEIGVVRADNGCISSADGRSGWIDLAWQVLKRHITLPIIRSIPSRNGCAPGHFIGGVAHRNAPGGDHADIAVDVGDHHALHGSDVTAHALNVILDRSHAGLKCTSLNGSVVIAKRSPLERCDIAWRQNLVEVAEGTRKDRPVTS